MERNRDGAEQVAFWKGSAEYGSVRGHAAAAPRRVSVRFLESFEEDRCMLLCACGVNGFIMHGLGISVRSDCHGLSHRHRTQSACVPFLPHLRFAMMCGPKETQLVLV